MKHVSFASTSFDVGHHTPHPPVCDRPHGHACVVTVGVRGAPQPILGSYVQIMQVLEEQLSSIRSELERKSLNDMIAPSQPTAAGLALWIWERLAMKWSGMLASVRVDLGELSHEVTSD